MIRQFSRLFKQLSKEFKYMEKNDIEFPIKASFHERLNNNRYTNVLFGRLSDGTVGSKIGFADDEKGYLSTVLSYKSEKDNYLHYNQDKFLTIFRTGLMMAYVVAMRKGLSKKIGIIGSGKINLMLAYILSILGAKDITLVGGKKDACKNVKTFREITNLPIKCGLNNLLQCDIVISCTNNNSKKHWITIREAPEAKLIIASDGGLGFSEQ